MHPISGTCCRRMKLYSAATVHSGALIQLDVLSVQSSVEQKIKIKHVLSDHTFIYRGEWPMAGSGCSGGWVADTNSGIYLQWTVILEMDSALLSAGSTITVTVSWQHHYRYCQLAAPSPLLSAGSTITVTVSWQRHYRYCQLAAPSPLLSAGSTITTHSDPYLRL